MTYKFTLLGIKFNGQTEHRGMGLLMVLLVLAINVVVFVASLHHIVNNLLQHHFGVGDALLGWLLMAMTTSALDD